MNFLQKNIKWVCHHAHLDKSNLISKESLYKTTVHMQDKWFIMEEYKKNIINQNCTIE